MSILRSYMRMCVMYAIVMCGIGLKTRFLFQIPEYCASSLSVFISLNLARFTWFSIDSAQDFIGAQAHNQLLWLWRMKFAIWCNYIALWLFQCASILGTSTQHQAHCKLNIEMKEVQIESFLFTASCCMAQLGKWMKLMNVYQLRISSAENPYDNYRFDLICNIRLNATMLQFAWLKFAFDFSSAAFPFLFFSFHFRVQKCGNGVDQLESSAIVWNQFGNSLRLPPINY